MNDQNFTTVIQEYLTHRSSTANDQKLRAVILPQENLKSLNTIGQAYHFIFDYVYFRMIYVEPDFTTVSGYAPENLLTGAYGFLYDILHPDDRLPLLKIIKKINQHWKCSHPNSLRPHVSFSYRIRKKNGNYIRLLHEWIETSSDSQGKLMYGLERCTDITHWQGENATVLMISHSDDRKNVVYDPKEEQSESCAFTKSEIRVLRLLAEGMSSKQIAYELDITFNTVNTHRRKMLKKAEVKNTTELIQVAYLQGTL